MAVLESGHGAIYFQDPDTVRAQRAQKERGLTDKRLTAQQAVAQFVRDGDYIGCDLTYFIRGPNALLHEIIRQQRKQLWFCAKYCYAESILLVGGGCVDRIDAGFVAVGEKVLTEAVQDGRITLTEWTNDTLTLRLLAGTMGVPFLPTRALLGTDALTVDDAEINRDLLSWQLQSEYSAGTPPVKLLGLLNEIFSTSSAAEVTTAWANPVVAPVIAWTPCGVEGRGYLRSRP